MKTFFGIILIITAVLGGIFVVRPRLIETKSVRAELRTYQEALEKAVELRRERERLLTIYNSLDISQLARLDRMIPLNIDNVKPAIEIENVASQLGLSLKDIDVKDPENESSPSRAVMSGSPLVTSFGSAEITFTVVGDYAQFVIFLERIERSLRLIDVRALSFTAPRSTTIDETYEFQVAVNTYWVRDIDAMTGL